MASIHDAIRGLSPFLRSGEMLNHIVMLKSDSTTYWYAGLTGQRLLLIQLDWLWGKPDPKTLLSIPFENVQLDHEDLQIDIPNKGKRWFHFESTFSGLIGNTPGLDQKSFVGAVQTLYLQQAVPPPNIPNTLSTQESNQDIHLYVYILLRADTPEGQILDRLFAEGLDRDAANQILHAEKVRLEFAKKTIAKQRVTYGFFWCIGGILVTAAILFMASPGGYFIFPSGIIIWGMSQIVSGAFYYLKPSASSTQPLEFPADQLSSISFSKK